MTERKKVGVIILNYHGLKDTLECIKSIEDSDVNQNNLTIYLVDNDSKSHEREKLLNELKKYKNIIYISSEKNLGFSGGNNAGIKKAITDGCEYLFLINNDTTVDKNTIVNLITSFDSDKKTGVIGAKIYFTKDCEYHKDRYNKKDRGKVIWYAGGIIDWPNMLLSHRGVDEVDIGQFDKKEKTDYVSGCAFLTKASVLKEAGFFNEDYFLYYEDADLCQRIKRLGYNLYYEPRATVRHKNASSSGKPGSPIHVYYQTRNRMLFGFKYGNVRVKIALLKEAIKNSFSSKTSRNAFLDFLTNNFGKQGNL